MNHNPSEAEQLAKEALDNAPQALTEPSAGSLNELLKETVALAKYKRQLDAAAKAVTQQEKKIHPLLMDEMTECGMQNANVDGMTVYVQEQHFVNKKSEADGVTSDKMCHVLNSIGWNDMVKDSYSAASLKSRVLERMAEGEDVPQELLDCLNITNTFKVVVRKG